MRLPGYAGRRLIVDAQPQGLSSGSLIDQHLRHRAVEHHLPLIEHETAIGSLTMSGQSVVDCDNGDPALNTRLIERLSEGLHSIGIERTRRLIEHQHRGVEHQGRGERQALLFSAR